MRGHRLLTHSLYMVSLYMFSNGIIQIHKDQNREIEEILETTKKAAWLNKIGTPDEIGQAAAFLASPAASFITGATLMVDGGSCEGNLH